ILPTQDPRRGLQIIREAMSKVTLDEDEIKLLQQGMTREKGRKVDAIRVYMSGRQRPRKKRRR
ncbi:MAG: hypothetical protein ACE5Z5_10255, partial [Candidatus Bathyarchaeia archaeon]